MAAYTGLDEPLPYAQILTALKLCSKIAAYIVGAQIVAFVKFAKCQVSKQFEHSFRASGLQTAPQPMTRTQVMHASFYGTAKLRCLE